MIKNNILYPIFLECCKFTTDIFWSGIFENLAYGRTIYGVYIDRNDYMCCNYKNKKFTYKIDDKDPEIFYNEVFNILTKRAGILSKKDKYQKKHDFMEEEKTRNIKNIWSDIKKKKFKELLIEQYVLSLKHVHNFSIQQCKYLLSILYIAMIFKIIVNKDIEYINGKIIDIQGLDYSDGKIVLKRDLYNIDIEFTDETILDKKLLSENWIKYLNNIKKVNLI